MDRVQIFDYITRARSGPRTFAAMIGIFILIGHTNLHAYKTDTHQNITAMAAATAGKLQSFLSDSAEVSDQECSGSLVFGSLSEDDFPRFFRHFYDPINLIGLGQFASAVDWGYSSPNNDHSWLEGRSRYFNGLTAPTHEERSGNLLRLCRGLGHIVHLMEDMAQPSHTRNDPHVSHGENPLLSQGAHPAHLEDWAERYQGTVQAMIDSVQGAAPIASFEDAFETLALLSNQNFFSDDTILKDYDSPAKEDTDLEGILIPFGLMGTPALVVTADGSTHTVLYLHRKGGPNAGKKLAQVGYFGHELAGLPLFRRLAFQIDDEVARENAAVLIPQAVRYSAGLLDYFFRGKLEVEGEEDNTIRIKNASGEAMDGTFKVYYDDKDGNRKTVSGAEWAFPLAGGQTSEELDLTPPDDVNEDGEYLLVFRGRLGEEDDAVIGHPFSLNTETPLFLALHILNQTVYWSIRDDGPVELENATMVSGPPQFPTSQIRSFGQYSVCGENQLKLVSGSWSCKPVWIGPLPGQIFLTGLLEPFDQDILVASYTGLNTPGLYWFSLTYDSSRLETFDGFRVNRGPATAIVGIRHDFTYRHIFHFEYHGYPCPTCPTGYIGVVYDANDGQIAYNYSSSIGIYSLSNGSMVSRLDEAIGSYTFSRTFALGAGDVQSSTGESAWMTTGAVTLPAFHASKVWTTTIYRRYATTGRIGNGLSAHVRIDRFALADDKLIHLKASELTNLGTFLMSKPVSSVALAGIVTGTIKE